MDQCQPEGGGFGDVLWSPSSAKYYLTFQFPVCLQIQQACLFNFGEGGALNAFIGTEITIAVCPVLEHTRVFCQDLQMKDFEKFGQTKSMFGENKDNDNGYIY